MIKIKNLAYLMLGLLLVFSACQEPEEELPGEQPSVNAGPDLDAVVGSTVSLTANATDPDGDPLSYSWTLTVVPSGSGASMSNASNESASFVPDVVGRYTVQVSVSDNVWDPVTDEVIVTVTEAVGDPPVVVIRNESNQTISEANENNSVTVGTPYMLDGSSSFDPDTDPADLTFTWEVTETPAGSSTASVTADAADPDMASFVPDVIGEYTISLTVEDPDGNAATETVVIVADANPVEISASINEPTVWTNVFEDPSLPDYFVTADITVSEQLEVMPGVKVMFEPNRRLSISGNSGALNAVGTADSLIVFTAEDTLNGWDGIVFYNDNALNRLDFTDISYGGRNDFRSDLPASNVAIEEVAGVAINNSTISNSDNYGLYSEQGAAGGFREFSNNTFSDNADNPVVIPLRLARLIDSETIFDNNGDNTVEVSASTVTLEEEVVVPALSNDTKYFVSGSQSLQSGVSIAAGVSMEFAPDVRITVTSDGYLNAQGTSTDLVSLTARDIQNGWQGVVFYSNDARNVLEFTSITYGGTGDFRSDLPASNVAVEEAAGLSISNSTISNSTGQYGLYIEKDGDLSGFSENSFVDNDNFPLGVSITNAARLDEASTFTDNGDNFVLIFGSTLNQSDEQTLPILSNGTQYNVTGDISLSSALVVSPGASLAFDPDTRISVNSGSSLSAVGTTDARITFTALTTADGWEGIVFFSDRASNRLDFVDISYGGSGNFRSDILASNIGVEESARVAISNTNITNSKALGLFAEDAGTATVATITDASGTQITTQAELEAAGNTFSNNTSGPSNLP